MRGEETSEGKNCSSQGGTGVRAIKSEVGKNSFKLKAEDFSCRSGILQYRSAVRSCKGELRKCM